MGEKFSLLYAPAALNYLNNNNIAIAGVLAQLFGGKGSPNYRAMCEGLVAYHNRDGGSPEVTEFEVIDSAFNTKTLSGYLKCRFAIHFHYTCSDIHNDAKDTIRWDFTIDEDTNAVHFTGEEPWVRDA